jgi:phosphoglycolate phosphatase-like HAD superfamily hydrolase
MKLVLFDIDGTLLWTDGAGRRAMEAAMHSVFGAAGPATYGYDGKTDAQIVRDQMRAVGHDDATIDGHLPRVLDAYLAGLEGELAASNGRSRCLAGVVELLDALDRREDRVVGLLTGNLARGAACKLRAVGLEPDRFRLGAYGSDHELRHELPAIAMQRAHDALGVQLTGDRLVIIGDTPSDIACGRGIGARAIAVATGRYTVEDLAGHAPAAVFPDLSDTAAVMRAIDDA